MTTAAAMVAARVLPFLVLIGDDMRQAVQDNYSAFTSKFEGSVPWMYLDVKGLVTTGIGNLIDSPSAALALPWKRPDGSAASGDEITAAWNKVKAAQNLKMLGGGNRAFQELTDLRLDADGIAKVVSGKLLSNETILKKRFPSYEDWPADAQLALHSMAWAMGANFNFPKFQAAANQLVPDFVTMAKESYIPDKGNPGLVPRNKANTGLFLAAADALKNNLDVTAINWSGFDDLLKKGTAAIAAAQKSVDVGRRAVTQAAKKNKGTIGLGLAASAAGLVGLGIYAKKKGYL